MDISPSPRGLIICALVLKDPVGSDGQEEDWGGGKVSGTSLPPPVLLIPFTPANAPGHATNGSWG